MHARHLILYLAIAATTGAVFGWFLRGESGAADTPAVDGVGGDRMPAAGSLPHSADVPGEADGRSPAGGSSNAASIAARASDATPGPSRVASPRSVGAATGPRPMSADNEARIGDVIAEMRAQDAQVDDLYTLLENEGRDPDWSDAAEAKLAEFLWTHGARLTGLEVMPPRCSRTVCDLTAVADPGLDTEAAGANLQRLLAELYAQDWFRDAFSEPRMAMTSRDDRLIYVTTFLHAEAGR